MKTQGAGSRVPKAVWHKAIIYNFCDICIRGIGKRFRPHTHFTKEGWEFVVNEFHKETGLKFGQKQLKNKWDSLKSYYKLWKDLMRNETGLGWDTEKNTVAADDAWWEDKIKANPNYANFRTAGVEPQFEEKLELMFSSIVATGEFAMSPGYNLNVPQQDEQIGVDGGCDSMEWNPFEENLDGMCDGGTTQPTNKRKNVRGTDNSSIPLKKVNRQSTGAAMLSRQIETLVSAVASRGSTVTSKVTEPVIPSVRATVADLKTLPGIDINSDLFMFATEFIQTIGRREVYLELETAEQKLNYLNYHFTHK